MRIVRLCRLAWLANYFPGQHHTVISTLANNAHTVCHTNINRERANNSSIYAIGCGRPNGVLRLLNRNGLKRLISMSALHSSFFRRAIDEASLNSLLASASDTRSRALALSISIPYDGDWLNYSWPPHTGPGVPFLPIVLARSTNETQYPICHLPTDCFGDL